MAGERRPLVYGPAYLDRVAVLASPLAAYPLDQSLLALRSEPRTDGRILLRGENGDAVTLHLPADAGAAAVTYELAEPILARTCGAQAPPVVAEIAVTRFSEELGGMGAGYAKALGGVLRCPLGTDAVGASVHSLLDRYAIDTLPSLLPDCPSDTSLLLLAEGEKVAVGVRQAMVQWTATAEDRALLAEADALVCCGAPNAQVAEILGHATGSVLCAPAMRNVGDTATPLADLAEHIHYLALNALEWAHLPGHDALRTLVPVITITDGPRGSRVLLGEEEFFVPADPVTGAIDTNRAGETYGAAFFTVLRREAPDFYRTRRVSRAVAEHAATVATRQAARQLTLSGFAFPAEEA